MQSFATRWIFAAILAAALLVPAVATPRPAVACSCVQPNLERQFDTATVAFRGEVEEIDEAGDHFRIEFDVEEYWKGEPARETYIFTHQSSATCGATFVEDREYFVLARDVGGRLETTSCDYNVDYESGGNALEAIQALGPGVRAQNGGDDEDDPSSQGNGDDPDTPSSDGGANGSDPGTGGSGDPGGGSPGSEDDGESAATASTGVDPDPVNVSAVVLASLLAAGAVLFVGKLK